MRVDCRFVCLPQKAKTVSLKCTSPFEILDDIFFVLLNHVFAFITLIFHVPPSLSSVSTQLSQSPYLARLTELNSTI